ncbi:hypothetical protein PIB30_067854 [Stylosanthes scabra]|uniref:Uncharacterized protein n=1 Tax=Stylosanthes scabra TaxID=79078 RepID=A0ABU6SP48_9FABA|nr:hypothetical protein [Stylosanthes scabra]
MEDLSMFQSPRSVALEYEKPETYGTMLIYPLDRLVECAFAGYDGSYQLARTNAQAPSPVPRRCQQPTRPSIKPSQAALPVPRRQN